MRFNNILSLITVLLFTTVSCQEGPVITAPIASTQNILTRVAPDSISIVAFFKKYPDMAEFMPQVQELYKKRDYTYIWYDSNGLIEFAEAIYNHVNQIDEDGISSAIPYAQELNKIFFSDSRNIPNPDSDVLISSLYFFYTNCVYSGLEEDISKETGWLIPREKMSYVPYLDSLITDPARINKQYRFSQYYNLKKALKKYREIEKNDGWGTIILPDGMKSLKPGDSLNAVANMRYRLFIEGYLNADSKSTVFDNELLTGVLAYKTKHNRELDTIVGVSLIDELNISVQERIKTIIVNMERCRWLSPSLNQAKEFIAVNIPSYRLHYFRNGKPVLVSKVVVGKEVTKTVVFSGEISYIAFSPYWNVPNSILTKEILPAIKKNPNYLAQHNMEWNGNKVRQKPGGNNSLGLVKFMFPNSNNIYLHDTPAKSLFNREERAFSHGCIRVEKARELAIAITAKDGNWSKQQVDAAMNAGKENIYNLKSKIPVYIAYFTAWADDNGNAAFFEDIYNRDERLAQLLFKSTVPN